MDRKRQLLEAAACAADRIAAAHEPHGCATGPIMREVGRIVRRDCGDPPRSGPAQVATDAYRENWETLFGKKQTVGQA